MSKNKKRDVVREIPVDWITPNPNQPRKTFNEESISRLALSLGQKGVIQPILLRRIGDNKYEIIAGERRWKAAPLAGIKMVPAIIKVGISEEEAFTLSLLENVGREDLNPVDEANAIKQDMDNRGLTKEAMAALMGVSVATLYAKLRILKLSPEIQALIIKGTLKPSHAGLANLPQFKDQGDRMKAAQAVLRSARGIKMGRGQKGPRADQMIREAALEAVGGSTSREKIERSRVFRLAKAVKELSRAIDEGKLASRGDAWLKNAFKNLPKDYMAIDQDIEACLVFLKRLGPIID